MNNTFWYDNIMTYTIYKEIFKYRHTLIHELLPLISLCTTIPYIPHRNRHFSTTKYGVTKNQYLMPHLQSSRKDVRQFSLECDVAISWQLWGLSGNYGAYLVLTGRLPR